MRRGVRLKGLKIVRRNGRRYVYRRTPGGLVALPDLPENDPRFLDAYLAADRPAKPRANSGTIAALCIDYLRSQSYRALAPSTQAVWRRTIDRIREERGAGVLSDLEARHLRKDLRGMSPGAASNRLKAWRALLGHAVRAGDIPADPSAGLRLERHKERPHRHWAAAEIAAFRGHWPAGTAERIAMEVIYWTGARCVDARTLGWQMVRDGWLTYTQAKTGGPATCPAQALPDSLAALSADHEHFLAALPSDQLQWIVTSHGKPRSQKGLSQWLSRAASAAGLPADCTAHGLRKARAAALAEAGLTAPQIGAWTGHRSLSEIAHYTRGADQRAILGADRERRLENRGQVVSISPKKANVDSGL